MRLNAIGIAMVTFVALLSVVQHHLSSIDPGMIFFPGFQFHRNNDLK